MGRPRQPAKVLELKGSFVKHPERAREDAEGSAPFEIEPPPHLPQETVRAWRDIVTRLPKVAIYNTDELAVEIAAKWLTVFRLTGDKESSTELRHWLGKLGFSPQDRTRLAPAERAKTNKFDDED